MALGNSVGHGLSFISNPLVIYFISKFQFTGVTSRLLRIALNACSATAHPGLLDGKIGRLLHQVVRIIITFTT